MLVHFEITCFNHVAQSKNVLNVFESLLFSPRLIKMY